MADETRSKGEWARGGLLGGGAVTGVFALVGASCCVLPLLLIQIGVSSAFAASLSVLEPLRWPLMGLTLLLALSSLLLVVRARGRVRARYWIFLAITLALLSAALLLPRYEIEILQWIRPS